MKYLFLISFILLGCIGNHSTPPNTSDVPETKYIDGEGIFKNNCGNCHKPNVDFTGPAIRGSLERWGNKSALVDFVKNSEPFLDNNYVKGIKKKYESNFIHQFDYLNKDQIMAAIYFCDACKIKSH